VYYVYYYALSFTLCASLCRYNVCPFFFLPLVQRGLTSTAIRIRATMSFTGCVRKLESSPKPSS